ncbi:MAG TPA: c-type cytochrome [Rhizomicrobium sp.]|nr:c-type cytochrome [Rhizomicrobium sp.]
MQAKWTWLFLPLLGLAASGALAQDQGVSAETIRKVTTVCQTCHGPQGNSASGTFPRLNGQQAKYIVAQLKNFREHSRSDPHAMAYMWGMAAQLDDALVADIAKYYASQKPTLPQTGGALAAQGKTIYFNGVEADHVPPCQACHGDHGEGGDEAPRIAGQHADYLKHQLEAFRARLRENEVMHANTRDMTDQEIDAVVSYLAND